MGGRALSDAPTLRVRWLSRVAYRDAHALQVGLFEHSRDDHLLLLEHDPVYTLGARGDLNHVLVTPADVGADLVRTDRGGDVTYHGPGQLVGYPILTVPGKRGGGMADTGAYVGAVEGLVIDVLSELGLADVGRLPGFPGVWVEPSGSTPRKIAAVGVRLSRGRSMHGFAVNVHPDLSMFDHIVPCGIVDKTVTSLAAEGVDVSMSVVVDAVCDRATRLWAADGRWERSDVVWRHRSEDLSPFSRGAGPGVVAGRPGAPWKAPTGSTPSLRLRGRLAEAGVADGVDVRARKPHWLRAPVRRGPDVLDVQHTVRDLGLVTVCEEAGCPNLSECWAEGTATFMLNGDRCTRACGFCLVDTRRPAAPDPGEPARVAEAVDRMGLAFAVLTAVARDDLTDDGASGFVDTVAAIRGRSPATQVEVLIPDCRGHAESLDAIFAARPDVLNHNLETVARLQRAVRPSASYARSLAVLARARQAGLTTKSGLMVGLGERLDEIESALADLAAVGVDIVTIGQYLRPTANHLPVARWLDPDEFVALAELGRGLGIAHVEAGPLTRSSYHAREAAAAGSVTVR